MLPARLMFLLAIFAILVNAAETPDSSLGEKVLNQAMATAQDLRDLRDTGIHNGLKFAFKFARATFATSIRVKKATDILFEEARSSSSNNTLDRGAFLQSAGQKMFTAICPSCPEKFGWMQAASFCSVRSTAHSTSANLCHRAMLAARTTASSLCHRAIVAYCPSCYEAYEWYQWGSWWARKSWGNLPSIIVTLISVVAGIISVCSLLVVVVVGPYIMGGVRLLCQCFGFGLVPIRLLFWLLARMFRH